jgi:hypothetical protein
MKDVLKNIFSESYHEENLPEKHFDRFSEKLDDHLHKPVYGKKTMLAYVAAIAAIVVLLTVIISKKTSTSFNKTILSMEDVEMIETEQYFLNEIDRRMAVIRIMEDTHKIKMLDDIKEFDSSLKRLKLDYNQTPGDDRIVNAVLTTYLMKIEALDKIMNILQKHS